MSNSGDQSFSDSTEDIEAKMFPLRTAEISPRSLEQFKLEVLKEEQKRRGAITWIVGYTFAGTILVGFICIMIAVCLAKDVAPIREFMTSVIPAELVLFTAVLTLHKRD